MILIYLIVSFLVAGLFFLKTNNTGKTILCTVYSLVQIYFLVYQYLNIGKTDLIFFTPDSMGIILVAINTIIMIPVFLHSIFYFRKREDSERQKSFFFAACVILSLALNCTYISNHIGIMWTFAEITTLATSVLVYHHRTTAALEATWKYIFICSISLSIVFIGILFLSIAGSDNGLTDMDFKTLISNSKLFNVFWLKLSFLFVLTGFTSKIGLVPLFTAGIDAKDSAPFPAGALLSSILLNLGFIAIFRMIQIIAPTSALE